MGWIKRNLFFAIGGMVALLLLGAAGYYVFASWSRNAASFGKLNEIYVQLKAFGDEKPGPGNAKVDNIRAARENEAVVRSWINRTTNFFQPIPPVPTNAVVSSEDFAAALRRMIDQLQHEAATASVLLPPKYGFSFEAQRSIVKFETASLPSLAVQLGEVKALAQILFASRVNSLDGIQRARVSDDDAAGPQSDYVNEVSVTNNLAVLTPYVVTFRGFSPELASVLGGLAASPHVFIVKALSVQPAGAAAQPGESPMSAGPMPVAAPRRGELPTVLNEQLLRITLEIVIVKPLPRK